MEFNSLQSQDVSPRGFSRDH